MSNHSETLISYGLEHGDHKVRELAEQFDKYRRLVSRFIGSEKPITITETSGERRPMYDHADQLGRGYIDLYSRG